MREEIVVVIEQRSEKQAAREEIATAIEQRREKQSTQVLDKGAVDATHDVR